MSENSGIIKKAQDTGSEFWALEIKAPNGEDIRYALQKNDCKDMPQTESTITLHGYPASVSKCEINGIIIYDRNI